jgi:hypothetical protein
MNSINKIDKTAYKIIRSKNDLDEEIIYWLDKTPQERLAAIEFLRQQYIQMNRLSTKMDKTVFEIHYGR